MNHIRFIFVRIALPVVFGIGIYILFRGVYLIDPYERFFPVLSFRPPDWFIYNLPDGLWLYALLHTLNLVWHEYGSIEWFIWLGIAVLLAISAEFFQEIQLISGTFDWRDIGAYIIAAFFFAYDCICVNNKKQKS